MWILTTESSSCWKRIKTIEGYALDKPKGSKAAPKVKVTAKPKAKVKVSAKPKVKVTAKPKVKVSAKPKVKVSAKPKAKAKVVATKKA